jgi:UDP-glucose 4-epimerase
MHLLVLGGDGFIGRSLTAALARSGHTLSVIGRNAPIAVPHPRPDGVIFAQHRQGASGAELEHLHIDLPLAWLEKIRPSRCLYLSTAEVYDPNHPLPYDEEATVAPRSALATAKRRGELALERVCGTDDGPKLTLLRLGSVYGPGQGATGLVGGLVKSLIAGRPVEGHPSDSVDLVYVDDVVSLIVGLFEREDPPHCLNVGGAEVALEDLVTRLAARLFPRLREPLAPRFDPPDRGEQRMRLHTARARALGWQPQMPLEEALEEAVLEGFRAFSRAPFP